MSLAILWAGLLGLVLGSFANVVIYRVPREGLSVSQPARSFCPGCGHQIGWRDNIPVVSWLLLGGHCRHCGTHISVRYPLVELAGGFLAAILFARFGLSLAFFVWLDFALCLLAVAAIDFDHQVIPMALVYPTMAAGLLFAAITSSVPLVDAILGGLLGWGALKAVAMAYKAIKGYDGLGSGDPALLGMIGVFLGYQALPLVVGAASSLGLVTVASLKLAGRRAPDRSIAFGPFMVAGVLAYVLI